MVERRKHKRYTMPRGTFVILRNELDPLRNYTKMSIGEIAMVLYKSESEVLGQISNISYGGIGFDRSYAGLSGTDRVELDLLMAEKGIYLHDVPFATIPDQTDSRSKKKTQRLRTNAIRFKELNAEQKNQLQELFNHHVG